MASPLCPEVDVGRIVDPDDPIQVDRLRLVAVLESGRIQGGHHVVPSFRALEWPNQATLEELPGREVGTVVVAQDDLHAVTVGGSPVQRSSNCIRRASVTPPPR